jgi:hypothetical protein
MSVHIRVILFCLVLCTICLILLLTGCTYRHAVVGQCADVATTAWGRHEGLDEANPVVGDSLAVLVVAKGALLWLAHYFDDENVNGVVAGLGYAAAAWNVGQILESK